MAGMGVLRTLLGVCLIGLATVHFAYRERSTAARSIFLGSWAGTEAARTAWAFVELAAGAAFLLWR